MVQHKGVDLIKQEIVISIRSQGDSISATLLSIENIWEILLQVSPTSAFSNEIIDTLQYRALQGI